MLVNTTLINCELEIKYIGTEFQIALEILTEIALRLRKALMELGEVALKACEKFIREFSELSLGG
jgi:hypothetical protein